MGLTHSDDLADLCRRVLTMARETTHGEFGLTALNLCNVAENAGMPRPSKRQVELALASLPVTRARHSWGTVYRLEQGQ